MNQDAFIAGFIAERRLQKEAFSSNKPKPPVAPAAPPAASPGGGTGSDGSSNGGGLPSIDQPNNQRASTEQPSQARLAKHDDLLDQQSIARQEGDIIDRHGPVNRFLNPINSIRSKFTEWAPDSYYKGKIDEQLNGLKPGQSVTPKAMGYNEMLGQDEIMQRPGLMNYAKQQGVLKSQQIAKATPLNELQQMNTGQMGGNYVLPNAIKQHIGNDPRNLEALTKIVGNKPGVYGMAGVGPGLKAKFTPQNFQFGQFANDHWGKILTGLAALLMGGHLAGQFGQGQQQAPQRQPEVWD
ncbi:MAG: hypothetical protein EBU46_00790 [Nitrosomonadaceae bacterium]|nr:hypothetical protein [Nitrosomonadaceae bacterium]